MNLSPDEVHAARALFAQLAVDLVPVGQRAEIPVETFAASVATATGLPFYNACDLVEAAIRGRKGISHARGKERVRFKIKEGCTLVIHRPGPPDEAELVRRLIVQTLLATPTWSCYADHVADAISERTGLSVEDVAELVAEAVPSNTEVLVKRHDAVHQIMSRKGRLSVREARFSSITQDWFALRPPAAVELALDEAKRYGVAA